MFRSTLLVRFSLLVSAAVLATACAPKPGQVFDNSLGDISTHDLDFARHSIVKIGEMKRMLETSMALKERAKKPVDSAIKEIDCKLLKLVGPDLPDNATQVFEELEVTYKKCGSDSDVSSSMRSKKAGKEFYNISYLSPLPRESDTTPPANPEPFPAYIGVDISTTADLRSAGMHPKDTIELRETGKVDFKYVGEDENQVFYVANYDTKEEFNYNVKYKLRQGFINPRVEDAQFIVDKKTRLVTGYSAKRLSFFMLGSHYEKTDLPGNGLKNKQAMRVNMKLTLEGDMQMSAAGCEVPGAVFKVSKELPRQKGPRKQGQNQKPQYQEFKVQTKGGELTGESTVKSLKLCTEEKTDVLAEDLAGVMVF